MSRYHFTHLTIPNTFGTIALLHKHACQLSQDTGCFVDYTFNGVNVRLRSNQKFDGSDIENILESVRNGKSEYYCK